VTEAGYTNLEGRFGRERVQMLRVPGAVVECGVWRGGSMMAIALALRSVGDVRDLYMYDTFSAQPPPGEHDQDLHGNSMLKLWQSFGDDSERATQSFLWLGPPSLELTQEAMRLSGHPTERIHYAKGRVERVKLQQSDLFRRLIWHGLLRPFSGCQGGGRGILRRSHAVPGAD
jgi:hypothetical protein